MRISIAPFTIARKPVSNWFMFKLAHYVVYRKQFPKLISDDVYTAALNLFETGLKPVSSASVNRLMMKRVCRQPISPL